MASIRKRGSKWTVDCYLGTQRKRADFSNKSEAEAYKRQLLLRPIDRALGYCAENNVTVSHATKEYLATVTPKKALRTQDLEKVYFEKFEKNFEGRFVSSIDLIALEQFQLKLRKEYQAATVNRHFNTYRHFFTKCKEWMWIRNNPTENLKNLKEEPRSIQVWKDSDIEKVLAVVQPWAKAPIELIWRTGIRRSCATSMVWTNVDLSNRMFLVYVMKGGTPRLQRVPMTTQVVELFERLKRKNGIVFVRDNGKPINPVHLSNEMIRAANQAGFKGMGLHDLRHSILTKMVQNNLSLEKVRQLAGHSNIRTTQRYLHVDIDDLRNDMQSLEFGLSRSQELSKDLVQEAK